MDHRKYVDSIPKIKEYEALLERQNLWWTVVAVVGKVNNHGLEPQLLDSVSETQEKFDRLKSQLIESLAKRYIERAEIDQKLKSQAFIDILNRNLFERTADIGFLATDQDLIDYLSASQFSAQARLEIENRLNEYIKKYSVYSDVVLLTPSLEVVASLNGEDGVTHSSSAILSQALTSSNYIEYDQPIDVVSYEELPLYFIQRVEYENQVIGLVCLSFKLEDELRRIHKTLSGKDGNLNLTLLNGQNQVLFNSQGMNPLPMNNPSFKQLFAVQKESKERLGYLTTTTGYQGYKGLDWKSLMLVNVDEAVDLKMDLADQQLTAKSELFPVDLYDLNMEINTALLIVVLNGKISSLKNNVKAFLPVLDSFQEIGAQVRHIFSDSISHIHRVMHNTMEEKALFSSSVALDVMDRNLYERANDCRWWALNPVFSSVLTERSVEQYSVLAEVLHYINSLYTVYSLLFVYDKSGTIVAISDESKKQFLGKKLSDLAEVKDCLKLTNSQQYTVSPFDKTDLYGSKPTYIYHAAIRSDKDVTSVVGGVGTVFSSEDEFEEILKDFLPKDQHESITEGAFSFFVDEKNIVISATENTYGLLAGHSLNDSKLGTSFLQKEQDVFDLNVNGTNYIVAKQESKGYREYKNTDGYINTVKCFVFVKS